MKTLLFIAALCSAFAVRALSAVVPATTYYFSSSFTGPSNGTFTNPFKNLTALDSILSKIYPGITAGPGDQFLLKRSDTFNVTSAISPVLSGAASAYIKIGEYGIGAKPVITGWKRITNWTNVTGTNKWYATGVKGASSDVTMLRMGTTQANATFQNIGRWPNRDQLSGVDGKNWGGYMDMETKKTSVNNDLYDTLIDANYSLDMPTRPTDNWVGGEIAIRNFHFRFSRLPILSNTLSGSQMTYRFDSTLDPGWDKALAPYGYFIQNHEKTLDLQGEWCYDKTADKLTIYSTTTPSSLWIEVPALNNAIEFKTSGGVSQSYYTIDNIDITGANNDAIYGDGNSSFIDVTNCNISFAGYTGIEFGTGSNDHNIKGNYIRMCMMYGILMKNNPAVDANLYIGDNIVRDIMPVTGMGKNGNVPGTGMDLYGNNILVEYNKLYNIGYVGIDINDGSQQRVTKNFGDSVNVRIDDGGGLVYTANLKNVFKYRDKVIDSNIAIHSHLPEAYIGMTRIYNKLSNTMCFPFYGDKWSNRWKFKGNIADKPQRGFYINDGSYDTLENNIAYDYDEQGFHLHNTAGADTVINHVIRENLGTGNIYYSSSSGASPFSAEKFDADTKGGLPKGYGVFEGQYLVYPMAQSTHNYFRANSSVVSAATWDTTYHYDTTSTIYRGTNPTDATASNISRLIYNERKYDSTIRLGGKTYKDAKTGEQFNYDSVRLAPFTGKVLLYTGTYIPNNAPTISITSPLVSTSFTSPASVVITAGAADADGSISKVAFYNGTTLLQTVLAAPYTYTWSGVATGSYTISAVATDNAGATTTASVKIAVVSSLPATKYKYKKITIN